MRALALLSGVASAGFAIGLVVGGVLTELLSWRWVLFVNVPFGLAAVVLAPRLVGEPDRVRGRLDVPGAVMATAAVAALVYGFIDAAAVGWSDPRVVVALVAGVSCSPCSWRGNDGPLNRCCHCDCSRYASVPSASPCSSSLRRR